MNRCVRILTIIISILCCSVHRGDAQLWRYINHDAKLDSVYESWLDKEASSIVTKYVSLYTDSDAYQVRTFSIRSFDGAPGQIAIYEKLGTHALSIECPGDSLKREDISGLVKIHFFSPDLLEVVYSPRGGSDEGYENALILGLNKGKLCVALDTLTIDEYSMPDEYGLYEARMKLTGQTLRDYKLTVNVREVHKSRASKSKNFVHYSRYILKFDEERKVFYKEAHI